jgi:hypothetical protein
MGIAIYIYIYMQIKTFQAKTVDAIRQPYFISEAYSTQLVQVLEIIKQEKHNQRR